MRAVAIVTVFLAGCLDDSIYEPPPDYPCNSAAEDAQVAGTWIITGSGTRVECVDELLDSTDLSLGSIELTITQDGTSIELAEPPSAGTASLSMTKGTINGSCVDFTFVEQGGPWGKLTWDFAGAMKSSGDVVGVFDGDGPGPCDTDGGFSLRIF